MVFLCLGEGCTCGGYEGMFSLVYALVDGMMMVASKGVVRSMTAETRSFTF